MPKFNPSKEDDHNLEKCKYDKLLHDIGIDFSKKSKTSVEKFRTEPSKNVSMFALNQAKGCGNFKKMNLNQLVKNVHKIGGINTLKRKMDKVELPSKKLSAPLPKQVADRVQRKVEYKKTSTDVSKWDPIVRKHRKADHISFPLYQEPFHIRTVDEHFNPKTKTLTPLEKEMYSLLSNNKCAERNGKELSIMEEETLAVQSLEDAKEKLWQLRQHRVLLSQHEAKNRRQNKIKSRQYHRMLKKQRSKEMSKEPVQELSSEAYDLLRAEERASLRHRKSNKWAKKVKIMSKHESQTRLELQKHLQKHKELMKKQQKISSRDCLEFEADYKEKNVTNFDLDLKRKNPWLKQTNTIHHEKIDLQSLNKLNISKKYAKNVDVSSLENNNVLTKSYYTSEESSKESKKILKKSFFQLANVNDSDDHLIEADGKKLEVFSTDDMMKDSELFETSKALNCVEDENSTAYNVTDTNASGLCTIPVLDNVQQSKQDIDVVKNAAKNLTFRAPTLVQRDSVSQQKLTIEEAFADDDIVSEFKAEKELLATAVQSENDVELHLPGWGAWGGSGVVSKKRKFYKRLVAQKRKDVDLGNVILNEKRDAHIAKHQVNKLPFPFTLRNQFENYIARPIGNTWNTPEVFSNAIKPKVSNPFGVAIAPLNSSEVFADQQK